MESKKEGDDKALVTSYKEKIESELNATCKEVLVSNLYYSDIYRIYICTCTNYTSIDFVAW